MHLTNLGWFVVVSLTILVASFGWIDRYAARHPYGTGRWGQIERERREREARRHRVEEEKRQQDAQRKARNEAVMTDSLARLRADGNAKASSRSGRSDDPSHSRS